MSGRVCLDILGISWLIIACLSGICPASDPNGAAEPVLGELGSDLNLSVDPFTGSVNYTIPIAVPPGRQGCEPKLSLRYGSGGGKGWCGVGWSLGMGAIQRDTRYGVPVDYDDPNDGTPTQYDDSKGFTVSFGAVNSRLVLVDDTNDIYRAETDQAFLKYQFDKSNNKWLVIDKSGNKYYFGQTPSARMVHPDFTGGQGGDTFLWALESIQDKNGNTTDLDYVADANQIYLDKITYNGNVNSPAISRTHEIDFVLEDCNDVSVSYATGYRVQTKKRLSEIDIEVSDRQVRRYKLQYAYSPSTMRSLLEQVTVYGTSDVNSLPPLTFDYYEQDFAFEDSSDWGTLDSPDSGAAWNSPHGTSDGSTLSAMMDINGDGLPDRVMMEDLSSPYDNFHVQLNTSSGFAGAVDWGPLDSPENTPAWNSPYGTAGGTAATMIDINRDGLPDRVMRESLDTPEGGYSKFVVQLNTGSGFADAIDWEPLDSPRTTAAWHNPHGLYLGTCVTMLDINGDGLPDRIIRMGTTPYDSFDVQLNTGSGFTSGSLSWESLDNEVENAWWGSPQYSNYEDHYVEMLDINGDGLPDRVMRKYGGTKTVFKVQLNTGYGFAAKEDWGTLDSPGGTSSSEWNSPYGSNSGSCIVMMLDINADGLPDRVMRESTSPYNIFAVQINNQSGFEEATDWTNLDSPSTGALWEAPQATYQGCTHVTMLDINGDGLPDRVMRKYDTPYDRFKVQLNKGPVPDLLKKVTSGLGGSVEVAYKPSTQYDNKDHNNRHRLGACVHTAASVTTDDGFGNENTTTYDYARGYFDYGQREFRGFGKVTITDPCDTTSVTYFHQGGGYEDPNNGEYQDAGSVAKKGMPYRVEVYGSDDELYSVTVNKVQESEVQADTGWYFAYVSQTIKLDYEGTENYRAKARQSTYDIDTGNIIKSSDFGEVNSVDIANHSFTDIADDSLFIHTSYETFTDPNVVNKIANTKTTSDANGVNILKEIVFDYNDVTCNVTESKQWLDRISDYIDSTTYVYDQYGNRTSVTNAVGITTLTSYDTTYRTYPVDVNTAGFVTSTTYDPNTGVPLSRTDVMGIDTEFYYDQFYRLTDVYQATEPEGDANLWLTHIAYDVNGINNGKSQNCVYQVHVGYEAYTYSDGLGRIIQTRVKSEPNATEDYRVLDVFYDGRGNVDFESLPYFSDGNDFTVWDSNTTGITTEYDAIGRVYKVTPPAGDVNSPTSYSTTQYRDANDLWVTVSTDPEGNQKKQYFDAQGRMTKLIEVITGDDDIVTLYEYDDLGRLIATTDSDQNQIEVTYDSLGRKIDANDPDMGYWTYEYDDLGRLTEQTDARDNIIEYIYDPNINRIDQKKIYDANETLIETVSYTYDTSDDPNYTVYKGLLYKVTDGQGWTKYGYDSRGRVIKTGRYIQAASQTYVTETSYDHADRVTEIIYPGDVATIAYSYDSAGNLIKVESTDGTGDDEVFYEPYGFNEEGRLTGIDYGNGVETRYEFYSNSKRLKRVHTYKDQADLQDLTYTFDKVSNIKSIADDIYSGSASCGLSSIQYDDLYRMTSLYSTAEGASVTYSYNDIGNITYNGEGAGSNYSYTGTRPHAVTSAYGTSYSYDACGNMTDRDDDTLAYDQQNRLVSVVVDSNTVSYGYAADGGRLYKKFNSAVVQVWIGDIYEEKDGSVLCHVYANGRLIASFEPESTISCIIKKTPFLCTGYRLAGLTYAGLFSQGRTPISLLGMGALAGIYYAVRHKRLRRGGGMLLYRTPYRQILGMITAAGVLVGSTPQIAYAGTAVYDPVFYYYHGDHLGSSEIMTDRDGDLVQHYGYRAFGYERYADNTQAFSVTNRYTGQELDEDTGLYYYGSRYYDPALARFIQPDSVVPDAGNSQALNRYSYVYNNPLKFTDPTGHFAFAAVAAIAAHVTTHAATIIASAAVSAGISAAQGGNPWKAAVAGAMAGAFGVGGPLWGAAGGALGALVTGGDPGMAAATAGIGAGVGIACGFRPIPNWLGGLPDITIGQVHLRALAASAGVGDGRGWCWLCC